MKTYQITEKTMLLLKQQRDFYKSKAAEIDIISAKISFTTVDLVLSALILIIEGGDQFAESKENKE